jgi:CDP-4-dehydro-6-deoxyglucose reductase, E3
VACGQALHEFSRGREPIDWSVEYYEVIAQTMHFREFHAHGGEEYRKPTAVRRRAGAYRSGAMTHSFEVRITPHGRVVRVKAEQSILDAALEAGLNLPHSCKSGHCSSCRARLLCGSIRYPHGTPLGLSAEEARTGHVLLCQARPLSDLSVDVRLVAAVADVEIKTLPCRIARLEKLAPDVMQVFLRLPSVESLAFQPGQYLDVLLEDGGRRSFSIANPPHAAEFIELHARYVPGGGFTERLFKELRPGALLRIEGPIGQFVYRAGTTPLLFIAGGTGFAPLKSMLRHILENGIERQVHLYWGAREPEDLYEEALVLDWTRRFAQFKFSAVLSEARVQEPGARQLGWVHAAVLARHPDLSPFDIYAAGPPALVEAIRATFPPAGARATALFFDSFDYAPKSSAFNL